MHPHCPIPYLHPHPQSPCCRFSVPNPCPTTRLLARFSLEPLSALFLRTQLFISTLSSAHRHHSPSPSPAVLPVVASSVSSPSPRHSRHHSQPHRINPSTRNCPHPPVLPAPPPHPSTPFHDGFRRGSPSTILLALHRARRSLRRHTAALLGIGCHCTSHSAHDFRC